MCRLQYCYYFQYVLLKFIITWMTEDMELSKLSLIHKGEVNAQVDIHLSETTSYAADSIDLISSIKDYSKDSSKVPLTIKDYD